MSEPLLKVRGLKIGATLDDVAPKTLATYEDGSIAATETTV